MNTINTISVMGFWYSGSSALYDYARQFEGVGAVAPQNCDETTFFECGIYEILSGVGVPDLDRISRYFRGDDPEGRQKPHVRRRAKVLYDYFGSVRMDGIIDEFLADLEQKKPLEASQNFLTNIIKLVPNSHYVGGVEQHVIFNNDPAAIHVRASLALPKGKITAVCRDPVDQYNDICDHYRKNYKVKNFLNVYRSSMQSFLDGMEHISQNHPERLDDYKVVNFEDFVKSDTLRSKWTDFCNITGPKRTDLFFPERSARNIGKQSLVSDETKSLIHEHTKDLRKLLEPFRL